MNRAEWNEIARAIHERRAKVIATWSPDNMDKAHAAHDRKLIYLAQLDALDNAARELARALKRRSSRFDEKCFLRACGAAS